MSEKANYKRIELILTFDREEPKETILDTDELTYNIVYRYSEKSMYVALFKGLNIKTLAIKKNVSEDEMLNIMNELSNMTYEEFKNKTIEWGGCNTKN
jgi:hypothetical protein